MSITSELIDHIRTRDVSPADLEQSGLMFLDALASAYAGANTPVGRKLIAWVKKDVLNTRTKAFLIGALTHITETDDLHRASVTHPGCVVVPCLMSIGQRQGCTDQQLLRAMLSGFEAMCRIGNAVGPAHYKIWHNTATCGPFGSAMAAADLLALDNSQTVHALGSAGTQSSGLWQFLETGAMSKHLHAGRGSEAGVLAAELSAVGFTGSANILEGQQGLFAGMCPDAEPDKVMVEPDAPWQLWLTSVKPWPSCRHTHPAIDAALEISSQLGNRVVESVNVATYQSALDLCDRYDTANEYQAKFSLQHCVAKALQDGEVTLNSFDEKARANAADLRTRVTVECADPYKSAYPVSWGCSVTVRTSDATEICVSRTDCKGDPELPLSASGMIDKAKKLLLFGGLTESKTEQICDQVLGMHSSNDSTPFMQDFLDTTLRQEPAR